MSVIKRREDPRGFARASRRGEENEHGEPEFEGTQTDVLSDIESTANMLRPRFEDRDVAPPAVRRAQYEDFLIASVRDLATEVKALREKVGEQAIAISERASKATMDEWKKAQSDKLDSIRNWTIASLGIGFSVLGAIGFFKR